MTIPERDETSHKAIQSQLSAVNEKKSDKIEPSSIRDVEERHEKPSFDDDFTAREVHEANTLMAERDEVALESTASQGCVRTCER